MTFCSGGPRPSDKGAGGGGGYPVIQTLRYGGAWFKIFSFRPFGPQFGMKIGGGASPPGPFPGSATVMVTRPDSPPLSYRRLVLVNVACVFNWVISRKLEREQKNMGRGRERGKEEPFPLSPPPSPSFFSFALVPTFSTTSQGNACCYVS